MATTEPTDIEIIDLAIKLIREVGHRHEMSPNGRRHLEFALAHLVESRIERSGYKAMTPEYLHKALRDGYAAADSVLSERKQ